MTPRFIVVRSPFTNPPVALVEAFERAALELPHDAAFAGVEIVDHQARRYGPGFELTMAIDRPGG
ncbi:MAG: hypothetical protein M3R44_06910, partial [Candidatus Eremiobacteraeota bacterium]|nr:hypothetical protein [Candidatus Eremiobacteraeota bacterium]